MKTLFVALATVCFATHTMAQTSININLDSRPDSVPSQKTTRYWVPKYDKELEISLGLNRLNDNSNQVGYPEAAYDLRTWGSRYVSLGFMTYNALSRSPKAALQLRYGLEFSWYNFMFEGNNVAVKGNDRLSFPESAVALDKSKLTASYLNVPLGLQVKFREGFFKHIGVGGYAGLRLGSHTKTKLEDGGKKDHQKGNFYLNDFRYGLTADLGIRKLGNFFVNYDLNNTFRTGKGPEVTALSFGIRL